ncbi:MAG: 50S ribosomal protein L25 [Patescibacteria group bacterium]
MDMVSLQTEARDAAIKPAVMRRNGKVPCVVYGSGTAHQTLACDRNELNRVYTKAGESTLIELSVGGKKVPVLIHELDLDPLSGYIAHVDFYAVDMSKEIEAKVPVRFTGESFAVKDLGAIFVIAHEHVTVKCLPKDLPHELTADISGLKEFHDVITVGSLVLPTGVTIKDASDTVVAVVQEPRAEEVVEVAAPVEGAVVAEGAVAGAEGAPAADGAAPAKEEKKK